MRKVTLKNLNKMKACEGGIVIFKKEYPKSIDIIPCIKRLVKEDVNVKLDDETNKRLAKELGFIFNKKGVK